MSTIGRVLYAMRHQSFMQMWLVVVLLGSWVRPSLAQEALTKLLVAHAGLISTHASVWLAEDQGFYKKHGLDATSVFTGSGSVTFAGINRRRGQSGFHQRRSHSSGCGSGSRSHDCGGDHPYNALSVLGSTPGAPAGRSERKRVAISTFGSGSHLAAEIALQVLGLDPVRDKIAIMQVGTQADRVAALVSGRVDATPFEPGFGQPAREKGLTMISDSPARHALLEYGSRCFAALRQRESADHRRLSEGHHRRLGFLA